MRHVTHRTTGEASSRRIAKASARNDAASAHWASSTTSTSGRSTAASARAPAERGAHAGGIGATRRAHRRERPLDLVDETPFEGLLGLVAAGRDGLGGRVDEGPSHQARLADARLAVDDHDGRPAPGRVREGRGQAPELGRASDQLAPADDAHGHLRPVRTCLH